MQRHLLGYDCGGERKAETKATYDLATIDEATIVAMIRDVARSHPDAITILCTNIYMRGAALVDSLEQERDIPIYASVALAVWASLRIAGVDPARVQRWGRRFRERI